MAASVSKSESGYWHQPSGSALVTAQAHDAEADLTLFASCFCPFVQRTWIALECAREVPYRYFEVDPYNKTQELLQVSPRGLVPALKLAGDRPRAISESTVIAEYVEDLVENKGGKGVLPPRSRPYARAKARFMADHVNRNIIPAFYRYLQAQETEKQLQGAKDFAEGIEKLCTMLKEAADDDLRDAAGLWLDGGELGWVDMMVAPWLIRSEIVLRHYRGWEIPQIPGYKAWLERIRSATAVKGTTSTDELYIDSYQRYAENRPSTSQVADAINSGRGLP